MKQSLVLTLVIASLFATSAQAAEGFISCLSARGSIISAGLDTELNLSNFTLQAAQTGKSAELKVYSITLVGQTLNLRAHVADGSEDSLGIEIAALKEKGKSFFSGTMQTNQGEVLGPIEPLVCMVKTR